VTILLFEPESDSGEFDEAHEVGEQLVVSSGDTTELLELVEETLDDVAFFVEIDVIRALDPAVSFRRDDGFCAGLGDLLDKMISVIALVGDHHVRSETVDKIVCEGDVVALPGRADQTDRIAKTIASGMDFGAQTAPRAAQALGICPLLPCVRQRHVDGPARWLSRSSAIPDRLRGPVPPAPRRERPSRSSDSNAVSPNDNCRTVPASRASGRLSAPSTTVHPETAGYRCGAPAYPCTSRHKPFEPFPLISRSASQSIADPQKSALNLICAFLGIPIP
jgi:hypothetical protein